MSVNRIATDEYNVEINPVNHIAILKGELRLENTSAYTPIVDLINVLVSQEPEIVTIDLRQVEFINSSGINSLSKFLMSATKQGKSRIVVKATEEVTWQKRMLRNVQRVVPDFELLFD